MRYKIEYLSKVTEKYFKEAKNCLKNKDYIAALIMYGSVLEALLLAMCFAYPNEVRETKTYKSIKNILKKRKKKRGIFLEFNLNNLIEIAKELNWLPFESIGIFENWVRWVQNSRNLVHPECWLKPDYYFGNIHEWMRKTPYKKYNKFVKLSDETIEVIRELLLKKIEDDIVRQLDKLKPRKRQNN